MSILRMLGEICKFVDVELVFLKDDNCVVRGQFRPKEGKSEIMLVIGEKCEGFLSHELIHYAQWLEGDKKKLKTLDITPIPEVADYFKDYIKERYGREEMIRIEAEAYYLQKYNYQDIWEWIKESYKENEDFQIPPPQNINFQIPPPQNINEQPSERFSVWEVLTTNIDSWRNLKSTLVLLVELFRK